MAGLRSGGAGAGREGRAVPGAGGVPAAGLCHFPAGSSGWQSDITDVLYSDRPLCVSLSLFLVRKTLKPPAEQYTNFWLTLTDKDTDILYNVKIRKILVFIIVNNYSNFINFIALG